ncbi:MAG: hypothetical protein PHX21_02955 [bacterium]|nr:hypothetical protein [bacterium]
MEKQDLDNLQQTTKDYSESGMWLSTIIIGVILVICGLMIYFKIVDTFIANLIFMASLLASVFGSKYFDRAIMRKGLGYVEQKRKIDSRRSLKLFLIGLSIGIISGTIVFGALLIKNWGSGIWHPVMLLGIGFVLIIIGLINRKKSFFTIILYTGVYFIVSALIWIFPMKHNFAHKMTSREVSCISYISMGLWFVIFGIIRYFQYKKIVQKVKGTN